jgi:hypothetical protein
MLGAVSSHLSFISRNQQAGLFLFLVISMVDMFTTNGIVMRWQDREALAFQSHFSLQKCLRYSQDPVSLENIERLISF